jgi:hypothetical protein
MKASNYFSFLCHICLNYKSIAFQLNSYQIRVQRGSTVQRLQPDPEDEIDISSTERGKGTRQEDENKGNELDIDSLLDTPLFDPDTSDSWFANLVKNDYNTAEGLYAGIIIAMGVILSQEALRYVKYGSAYVPFHGSGGRLF